MLFVLHTHVLTQSGVRRPYYQIEPMLRPADGPFARLVANMIRNELTDPVIAIAQRETAKA